MKNKARTRKKRRQAKAVLKHGRSAAPQAYRKKRKDRHDVLKAAEVTAYQGGTEVTDILNELSALAAAIHYPECWDTAAYPDLLSALREVTASTGCSVCKPQVEQEPVAYIAVAPDGHESVLSAPCSIPRYRNVPLYAHPAPDQSAHELRPAGADVQRRRQLKI